MISPGARGFGRRLAPFTSKLILGTGTKIGGGATAEQETQGIDYDRLAAPGFAGQQVQTAVESNADSLDDGVIFDG